MANIIICPEGGLANRLRVISSALAIQHKARQSLDCIWAVRRNELNAHFADLFQPINGLKIINPPPYLVNLRPALSRHALRRLYCNCINRSHGIGCYLYQDSSHPGVIEAALPSALSSVGSSRLPLLIRTWQAFGHYRPFLQLFLPIFELQDRINATIHPGQSLIGIHVRRTDHSAAIRFSPLQGFFKAADQALLENSGSKLMLCTDDQSVRDAFRRRYRHKVLVSNASLSRDSPSAIQDAVVDLFCLSRCIRIIGSYHSSFSELAAMIGERPLHTVGLDAP